MLHKTVLSRPKAWFFTLRPLLLGRGLLILSLLIFSFHSQVRSETEEDFDTKELEQMMNRFRQENLHIVKELEERVGNGENIDANDLLDLVGRSSKAGDKKKMNYEETIRATLSPIRMLGQKRIKENYGPVLRSSQLGKILEKTIGTEKVLDFFAKFVTHKEAPYKMGRMLDDKETLKIFIILNIAFFILIIIWRIAKRKTMTLAHRFKLFLFAFSVRFTIFYVLLFPYLDETWWIIKDTFF